ncbi:Oidioi.mRNA.OKI2018_I69.XSR.g16147.t1.cds [Oikopleura dioica]|uniref:Oidioi.mRNA.OKI2018_I69.XSR.g16147.t1.cds n=1 Tax=Oikopleura dioica TaxID=34765 RepID=A0ABN7SFP3_OIKDI|nr:Oidioi.mRNA.OKI2018_I69.XSR.g16147.t1.cds [Oikopleura dioica]
MKLRSRKIDADGASTSAPKIARMESFESIFPGMLISYGKFGKCVGTECDGVPLGTAEIQGRNLCGVCATEEYGSDFLETEDTSFEQSDAKFKCPAYGKEGSCNSKMVSIDVFYLGTCCEPASKVFVENKKAQEKQLKVVHHFYRIEFENVHCSKNFFESTKCQMKGIEDEIQRDQEALEEKMKKVEEDKKILEGKKKHLERMNQNHEASKRQLIKNENVKNDVLKRLKQLSYQYHSVATKLSLDEDVEAKENRKDFEYCKACGENYNETDRRKSFLPTCGHVACLKCFEEDACEQDDYPFCPMNWVKDCDNQYYLHEVRRLYE